MRSLRPIGKHEVKVFHPNSDNDGRIITRQVYRTWNNAHFVRYQKQYHRVYKRGGRFTLEIFSEREVGLSDYMA